MPDAPLLKSEMFQLSTLGGGNSNIFGIFTPEIGEVIQFDEHIFPMGWLKLPTSQ